jgi:dephospho-CoA kinase
MLKVGLTGGIGSGKSTVANLFKTLGVPLFDADASAKNIMESDAELQQNIKQFFGEESYIDGKLNRKYIANIVFNNKHQLEILNSLVHPATIRAAEHWMQQQKAPYVIKEAALFFEAGTANGLNYMVGVYSPQHIRIKRVMERDHVERQDVLARMDKQIDEDIKMKLCDFVIVNDEQQMIIPQVLQLHEQFILLSKQL